MTSSSTPVPSQGDYPFTLQYLTPSPGSATTPSSGSTTLKLKKFIDKLIREDFNEGSEKQTLVLKKKKILSSTRGKHIEANIVEISEREKNKQVASQLFYQLVCLGKKSQECGFCVSVYSPPDYKKIKLFIDTGGAMGFALKKDEEISTAYWSIVSVFKNKHLFPSDFSGSALDYLMPKIVREGGRYLDCFNAKISAKLGLPFFYSKYDFKPVAKVAFDKNYQSGWDTTTRGEPDIIYMVYSVKFSTDMKKLSMIDKAAKTTELIDGLSLCKDSEAAEDIIQELQELNCDSPT